MTRGFTLIETVIVAALSVAVMVAIAVLIYNFNKISGYDTLSAQSSGSANALMREIGSLTLSADAVLKTHTFSSATRTSSSTALVLELPSIDSSGNVIPNAYDYGAFYTVGTNAYRLLETNAGSARTPGTKLFSTTISALAFSYNSTDFATTSAVTVDIQTRAQSRQNVASDHLHEQFQLRNY